jgi:hypothetical protein
MSPALTIVFSSPSHSFQLTNAPPTDAFCCNYRPQKEEKHLLRLTIGDNWINYPGKRSTPMVDLTTAELLINSTISTPGAKFLGINLADFYLNTPMLNPKYIRLCLDIIPDNIIVHYNLSKIDTPDG